MTITLGSWAFPLAFTLVAIAAFIVWDRSQPPASGYGAIGAGLVGAIAALLALVAVLIAWLVWAVLT